MTRSALNLTLETLVKLATAMYYGIFQGERSLTERNGLSSALLKQQRT
jgi:hypothetical protein